MANRLFSVKISHLTTKHFQPPDIDWQYTMVVPDSRKKGRFIIYKIYEPATDRKEYRLIWVHSISKEKQDKSRREHAVKKVQNELSNLCKKLNKRKLKNKE